MPKQWYVTTVIDLPEDQFEEAQMKLDFKAVWDKWQTDLADAGVKASHKLEGSIEKRAPPAAPKGRPVGSKNKPKQSDGAFAQKPLTEDQEAMVKNAEWKVAREA